MMTTKRFLRACGIAFAALAAATVVASADTGHDDSVAKTERIGTVVAFNPQPIPWRCLPPGCKGGGRNGPAKFRSLSRKV
jgi:hypothetical protein